MEVRIGNAGNGWRAVSGSQIVAFAATYSELFFICKQNGWTIIR